MYLHKKWNSKNCGGRQRQLQYVRINAGISETDRCYSKILDSVSSQKKFFVWKVSTRELKRWSIMRCTQKGRTGTRFIPYGLWACREIPNATTGVSPFEMGLPSTSQRSTSSSEGNVDRGASFSIRSSWINKILFGDVARRFGKDYTLGWKMQPRPTKGQWKRSWSQIPSMPPPTLTMYPYILWRGMNICDI